MSPTTAFAIIILVVIAALTLSAISYSRQQAIKAQKARLAQLKSSADEIYHHLSLFLRIDPDYQTITLLQNLLIHTLKTASDIVPQDTELRDRLAKSATNLAMYKGGSRANEIQYYVLSDNELTELHSQLGQACKFIDICKNRGIINLSQHAKIITHLQHIKLEVDINSHVVQANQCALDGDMVSYQLHLKQAKETLSRSKLNIPDKLARVKRLSEVLNDIKRTNKVVDLSADFPHLPTELNTQSDEVQT